MKMLWDILIRYGKQNVRTYLLLELKTQTEHVIHDSVVAIYSDWIYI